jgi:hypothetical protein
MTLSRPESPRHIKMEDIVAVGIPRVQFRIIILISRALAVAENVMGPRSKTTIRQLELYTEYWPRIARVIPGGMYRIAVDSNLLM